MKPSASPSPRAVCPWILLFVAAFGLGLARGRAATLSVTSYGDSGAGTLRAAIAAANATPEADTIVFPTGFGPATISLGTADGDVFGPSAFVVGTDITLDGGVNGVTLVRDTSLAPHRLRFFHVTGAGTLRLKNLTLSGGLAQGGDGQNGGLGLEGATGGGAGLGGAIVNAGRLFLDGCLLVDNQALGGNGASPLQYDPMARAETPSGLGGSAGVDQFGGVRGFGGGGGYGWAENDGWWYIAGGHGGYGGGGAVATAGMFPAWQEGGYGGGHPDAWMAPLGSGGGAGMGGAVFNYGGSVTAMNSTLTRNKAAGGVTFGHEGETTGGFRAWGLGGAIYNLNGTVSATSVTASGNFVDYVGASHGGALFSVGDRGVQTQAGPVLPHTTATVVLRNSIFADSRDRNGALVEDVWLGTGDSSTTAQVLRGTESHSGSSNIIQTGENYGLGITANPHLAPLDWYSGPTKVLAFTAADPPYNAGDNAVAGATDQRGVARPSGGRSDIGAFELDFGLHRPVIQLVTVPGYTYGQGGAPIVVDLSFQAVSSFPMYGTLVLSVDGGTSSVAVNGLSAGAHGRYELYPPVNSAGWHSFTLTFTPNNYALPTSRWVGESVSGWFHVSKATPVIQLTRTQLAYDGSPKTPEGRVTGVFGSNLGSPGYTFYAATDTGFTSPLPAAPSALGDYLFSAWYPAHGNYNDAQILHGTMSIVSSDTFLLVVDTLSDVVDPGDGVTSLREAVDNARVLGGDRTLTFSPALFTAGPGVLSLTGDFVDLSPSSGTLRIIGPGASVLTIASGSTRQVFRVDSGSVELEGITVANGHALQGGLIRSYGSLVARDCVFRNGLGQMQGGAVYNGGYGAFLRCSFLSNQAGQTAGFFAGRGGAVANEGTLWLVNCTLHGNTVESLDGEPGVGGAVANLYSASTASLVHCTVTGNSCQGSAGIAGGVAAGTAELTRGSITLRNTILTGNTAPTDANYSGTVLRVGQPGNLVGVDPSLVFATGLPAIFGGTTPTVALKAGGPAVDAGQAADSTDHTGATLTTDQRGSARVYGAGVDSGAFEGPVALVVSSPTVNSVDAFSARLGGTVGASDAGTLIRRGVVLAPTSVNSSPTLGGAGVVAVEDAALVSGVFQLSAGGLEARTAYSFVAFAEDADGIVYSPVGTFRTTEQAGLVVTTTADSSDAYDGETSLREAVSLAAAGAGRQVITFSPSVFSTARVIALGLGPVDLTSSVPGNSIVVQGPGSTLLALDGNEASRVLQMNGGAATVTGLTVTRGRTTGEGGGVLLQSGQLGFSACRITANHALNGAGLAVAGGSLTLSDCQVDGNATTGTGSEGLGGGLGNFAGTVTLSRCSFSGNEASYGGGAVCSGRLTDAGNGAVTRIDASALHDNTGSYGGAVLNALSTVEITHSTLARNVALRGGGLYSHGGWTTRLSFCTVSRNTATSGNGGGLASNSTLIELANSVVAWQSAGTDLDTPLTDGGHNFIGGDPRLDDLGNHGGPTLTLAPLPGSPLIDAGPATVGSLFDQRGAARVVGAATDIGAVEADPSREDFDGDGLTNEREALVNADPLAIDTDGDGFNDATELLSGSDPASGASVPGSTHIERVLGFGPARGLDLSGRFLYALNLGAADAENLAGAAGDAVFTGDDVAGVTLSAGYRIASWNQPSFGDTGGDDALEQLFRSIRWSSAGDPDPALRTVEVTLAGLVPGVRYKLQALFGEGCCGTRTFDILVNGVVVVDDFKPADAQGNISVVRSASAVVHEFIAPTGTARLVLGGGAVPGGVDPNPILNGLTLEEIPTPQPEIAVQQPAGTDLADGGSRDFGSVLEGGEAFLQFTVLNTGDADLTGLGITLEGTGADSFEVSTAPTAPVAGSSGTTTFTVRFHPDTAGVRTAVLRLASNDFTEADFDITLTGTGLPGVVNAAPTAQSDSIQRDAASRSAKVPITELLRNDSDPDDDPLSLVAVGHALPAGSTVTVAGRFVVFLMPEGGAGDGSFEYTLGDGPGGHAVTGMVTVTETGAATPASAPSARITAGAGGVVVTFVGVPGHRYRLQYSEALGAPGSWRDFDPSVVYTAPPSGLFSHTDAGPGGGSRFYRIVAEP